MDYDETDLKRRIVEPWQRNEPIVVVGQSVLPEQVGAIRILHTGRRAEQVVRQARRSNPERPPSLEQALEQRGEDVTQHYLRGPLELVSPEALGDDDADVVAVDAVPLPLGGEGDRRPPTVLTIGTEWGSSFGGLSTFNRGLASGFAELGCEVACLVPEASDADHRAAQAAGVRLIEPPARGRDPRERLLTTRGRDLNGAFEPQILIGHGRVTGEVARVLADDFSHARRVHIMHTSSGTLEWEKGRADYPSTRGEQREEEEMDLAASADLAAAVGPRLLRELRTALHARPRAPASHEVLPGMAAPVDVDFPEAREILLCGRLEDAALKGARVLGDALGRIETVDPSLTLRVRGVPPSEATALRADLQARVNNRVSVSVYDYADRQRVEQDLRRASLVVMPSREEGFGLVAIEALAYGRPLLVSSHSGFAEWIKSEFGASVASRFVVDHAATEEVVVQRWSQAIDRVLQDLETARTHALDLQRRARKKLCWRSAARCLLEALEALENGRR